MPLSAKKMCGAAGVNSSSQVSGASAKSLQPKCPHVAGAEAERILPYTACPRGKEMGGVGGLGNPCRC